MTARDDLDHQLIVMASDGRRPRCGHPADSHLWTSEEISDRRRAARLCSACPLLRPCAEAAEETAERFHVWAGQDRTATTKGSR